MTNKYKGLEPVNPGSPPVGEAQMGLDGGYRGDVSPFQIPPNSSPDLSEVRFERSALRKDFGWTPIGAPAANRVLGIVEHKFLDSGATYHRIARFTRIGGKCRLEVWDGTNWVVLNTTTTDIADVYLSAVSALGAVYVADGLDKILEWTEAPVIVAQEDDFPTLNSITGINGEVIAVVSPADTIALDYRINYDVEITTSPDSDVTIELSFYHEGILLGKKTYNALTTDTFPVQLNNEIFDFNRLIANNDDVSIKMTNILGGDVLVSNGLTNPMGSNYGEGAKTPATQEAHDDRYNYKFTVNITVGATLTVGIYTWDGVGWTLRNTGAYEGTGSSKAEELPIILDGFNQGGAKFGIKKESITMGFDIDMDADVTSVSVEWLRTTATFDIHGHNKAVDADPTAGVEYTTESAPTSTFAQIADANTPKARYLIPFARRIIALIDDGDEQSLAWPADGVLTDWTSAGSGQIYLVESRNDPIDPLRGGAVLGSNFLAIFRARSIWRAFETGAQAQAIGAVSWIEDLGTASPFSIQHVLTGAIFLGHDLQVYFLSERGPEPIGTPIQEELIASLPSNLHLVDSAYDSVFAEYYLGIPEDGASQITKVWIFDVDKFVKDKELVWRSRPMNVERFAVASEVE